MYFQKDDWFEVGGGTPHKVVYADELCFVSRAAHHSADQGLFLSNDLTMYSNRQSDYNDKYWIRKITPPTNVKLMTYRIL